jgi:hypothetical protein
LKEITRLRLIKLATFAWRLLSQALYSPALIDYLRKAGQLLGLSLYVGFPSPWEYAESRTLGIVVSSDQSANEHSSIKEGVTN